MNERNEPKVATEKFENASKEGNKAIEAAGESLKNLGNTAKNEAEKAYASSKEHVEKAAQSLSEGACEAYNDCREEGEEYLQKATATVQNLQSRTEKYIRAHPFKCIFITFGLGAGCVLAAIFKLTRRNKL